MAYYTEEHRARLELIRALQDHGFTLSAIEKYLARVPADASVEDLALQRAMLTSWGAGKRESMTRRQLETRARRKLGEDEIQRLVNIYAIRIEGYCFELLPPFEVALKLMEIDIPVDSMEEAAEAISRHMDALADELTHILRTRVLAAVPGPGAQRSRQGPLRGHHVAVATADARGGRCRLPAGGQPGDHPFAVGLCSSIAAPGRTPARLLLRHHGPHHAVHDRPRGEGHDHRGSPRAPGSGWRRPRGSGPRHRKRR